MPSGWDSKAKLGIIEETLKDPDVPILQNDDLILPLLMGASRQNVDNIIEIEDEQVFLNRMSLMTTNDSGTLGGSGGGGPNPSPKRDHSVGERNSLTGSGGGGSGNSLQNSDSTALMSFFNNLLKKDTGGRLFYFYV